MGSIIKTYAAFTGGAESAIASFDVPQAGFIVGCQWAVQGDMDTDLDAVALQLSFGAAGNFNVNDVRNVVSEVRQALALVTAAGSVILGINMFVPLPDIPVAAGERMYVHSSGSATTAGVVVCLVHFDFQEPRAAARRR